MRRMFRSFVAMTTTLALVHMATSAMFAAPAAPQGVATVREYRGIGSVELSRLRESPRYPANPDFVGYSPGLEWPSAGNGSIPPGNNRNNYGWTITGYLYPPTNGVYTFHIAANNQAEFWLSSDDNPASARLLCRESVGHSIRAFADGSKRAIVDAGTLAERFENASTPITLVANRAYWFQALAKEGGGTENLAVTWTSGVEKAVDGQAPIPGEFLSSDHRASGPVVFLRQPQSQSVVEGTRVALNVEVDGTPGYRFQWTKDGQALPGTDGSEYAFRARLREGGDYAVEVTNREGTKISAAARITVSQDTNAPIISRVNVTGRLNTVVVTFNEILDKTSAELVANYSLSGGVEVQSASLDSTGTVVTLKTSQQVAGQELELTVNNVKDDSAAGNAVQPNSMFKFKSQIFTRHFATLEKYPASSPSDLLNGSLHRRIVDGAVSAASAMTISKFEGVAGIEEGLSTRLHGVFIPQRTANYVFFCASAGPAALFLSSNTEPTNAVVIATEPEWNPDRAWLSPERRNAEAFENRSVPIPLQAGNRYYLALTYMDGEGGGGGAVTVKREDEADPRNRSAALAGTQIGTWTDPNGQELQIIQHPEDLTVFEQRSATFSVKIVSSDRSVGYQWKKNGIDIPNANDSRYVTPKLSLADSETKYSVEVTIPGVVIVSKEATVTVLADKAPPGLLSVATLLRENSGIHEVTVAFDEEIVAADAAAPGNFSISAGTITQLTPIPRSASTILSVTGLTNGEPFKVSVRNIKDPFGNLLVAAEMEGTTRAVHWAPVGANELALGNPAAAAFGVGGFDLYSGGSSFTAGYEEATFVYEKLKGDFDKKVRIQFQDASSVGARAGLMVREILNEGQGRLDAGPPFSRYQQVSANPSRTASGAHANNAYELSQRLFPGGFSSVLDVGSPAIPEYPDAWVRLQRRGQEFSLYRSNNGIDWILMARQRYPDHFGSRDAAGNPIAPFPETLLVGPSFGPSNREIPAESGLRSVFKAEFRDYGDVIAASIPGPIAISAGPGGIVLSWQGSAILQSAPTLDGPWIDVPGAFSPHTLAPGGSQISFYRLRL